MEVLSLSLERGERERDFGVVLANGRAVTVEPTPVLVFQNNAGQEYFQNSREMLFLSAEYLVIGCIFSSCDNFLLVADAASVYRSII